MIASNTIMKNEFTTMVQYPNNNTTSLCRNINLYTKPDFNNAPELITERTSSISSGSTEETNFVPKNTSLNATKLEEEPNPFEQSFETLQNEIKVPETTKLQHLNSVPSVMNNASSKSVTFIKRPYHDNQSTSNIKRNRKRTSELEGEEKRKNFLERNRIELAALKCRQRKKQWLQNLQTRVKYLAVDNEQYYIETNALREELVNLKMLLLAHKECPMDQQAIRNALNQTIPTVPVASQMISHLTNQPN